MHTLLGERLSCTRTLLYETIAEYFETWLELASGAPHGPRFPASARAPMGAVGAQTAALFHATRQTACGQAFVLIQARDPENRRDFASAATATVQWVGHSGQLIDAVRALDLPAGEGYAWCAAEARVAAELRRILVDEKGHGRHAIRAAAYWKKGAVAHHENLES